MGLPPAEAERLAYRDSFRDLGYTMMAGVASGMLNAAAQTALEIPRQAGKKTETTYYSIQDILDTRRELRNIRSSPNRLDPEGQRRWAELEQHYGDMRTYFRNRTAAVTQNQQLKGLPQQSTPMPFSPELYRLAVEMSAPFGYSHEPIQAYLPTCRNGMTDGAYQKTVHGSGDFIDAPHGPDQSVDASITIEAKPGTRENPIDVHLKYKQEWTDEQRVQADAKLQALSEGYTEKSITQKQRKPLKETFLKINNLDRIPEGYDLDHIIDLQLGGLDDIMNTQLLDRSVNRSLGAQIMHAIAQYEVGTVLGKFTID